MIKKRVAIVVLNWNCADDSIKCMESLIAQTHKTDIILVDNASSDNSINIFKKYISDKKNINLIKNTVNSGYTGGNNVGFKYALKNGYDFIGTLNPDAVADKDWVKNLVSIIESDKSVGIATGILARSDKKTLDSTGDFYTTWGIPSPRGRNQQLSSAPKLPEYVFGSTGGGFIARASLFRIVGLFDEKFFMYFEDVDLSFRSQLAGFKIIYNPKSIAYHKISASTNKVPGLAVTQTFKNLPVLFMKNVPLGLWWKIAPRFAMVYILISGNSVIKGRGLPAIKGWLLSIKLLPHAIISRRKIQKNRKVTNKYIDSIILKDIPPEQTGLLKFKRLISRK